MKRRRLRSGSSQRMIRTKVMALIRFGAKFEIIALSFFNSSKKNLV